MFSTQPTIYGMPCQARCIAAVEGDPERHRFLVGSTSLREANEVHLVELNDELNELGRRAVYAHEHEIWQLAPCPRDAALLATVYNDGGEHGGAVWRLPAAATEAAAAAAAAAAELDEDLDGTGEGVGGVGGGRGGHADGPPVAMERLAVVGGGGAGQKLRFLAWEPADEGGGDGADGSGALISVHDAVLRKWDVGASGSSLAEAVSLSLGADCQHATALSWNPHTPSEVAVAGSDCRVGCYDLRINNSGGAAGGAAKPAHLIEAARDACVRSVDYNPNKPYHLVCGGDDCGVKFWDVRKSAAPLKVLRGHSHWVWNVRFNPFHDQLVLSASTDARVKLWRAASISSAPLVDLEDEDSEQDVLDKEIKTYEFEDSVYSVAWSACDAWVFGCVSYDGRVTCHHVPSAEKYKILL